MNAVAAFGPGVYPSDEVVDDAVGRTVGVTAGVLPPPPPPHAASRSDAVTMSAAAAGATLMPVMEVHRSDAD